MESLMPNHESTIPAKTVLYTIVFRVTPEFHLTLAIPS